MKTKTSARRGNRSQARQRPALPGPALRGWGCVLGGAERPQPSGRRAGRAASGRLGDPRTGQGGRSRANEAMFSRGGGFVEVSGPDFLYQQVMFCGSSTTRLFKIGLSVLSPRPEEVSVSQGKVLSAMAYHTEAPGLPPKVANLCECSTALALSASNSSNALNSHLRSCVFSLSLRRSRGVPKGECSRLVVTRRGRSLNVI